MIPHGFQRDQRPPPLHLFNNEYLGRHAQPRTSHRGLAAKPNFSPKLQDRWGPHSIDRCAPMLNTHLPCFNARWRDPHSEDVDRLHLPDAAWRRENIYCNPPWIAPPTLAVKLR
jgi:hypothetical protein